MKNLNKYLGITFAVMVVVMLATQLVALVLLGTKGSEITDFRRQQDEYRQAISATRSDIDSVRTLAFIQDGMKVVFPASSNKVNPVSINLAKSDSDTLGLAANAE